nr:hypothetical protein [Tanacetum cinerariifolium]
MALVTRQGPNAPPNDTNPNNMTLESVQAMIDQALMRNSTNRDESHNSHRENRRNVQTIRPCFYTDFMKFQPLNFKGTGTSRDLENQVKFTTYTMENQETRNRFVEPEGQGNDVPTYTERFQELTLLCTKFVANETEKINKNNHGHQQQPAKRQNVAKVYHMVSSEKKPYGRNFPKNNHGHQQQPAKRQNVAKVYHMVSSEKKPYGRNFPKFTKCYFYHNDLCTQKCHKCNKVGHFTCDCKSLGNTNVANAQRENRANSKGNGCFECRAPGHFKRDCPKLKNKDGGNVNAQGWVYAVGNVEKKGNASRDPNNHFGVDAV